jgi:UDP-2,3-diacylglucosamine pyrophosphatase LpxH
MPDIRYVCLSDLHLGADSSVLPAIKPNSIEIDPLTTSPALSQFVACLQELIRHNEGAEKPKLILNGDILELALADTNKAAMVFEDFINLVFPSDGEALFDKNILYIPGNHDHHIWESARETQYVHYITGIPAGHELPAPWHTTKMFAPDLVQEYFSTSLLLRHPHLQDAVVNVVYPNYALTSDDGQKCIIVSHGHYIESIYSLMITLNTMFFPNRTRPKVVWELEAENFAWIDFLWSTLGRSGDVGQDIGIFYAKLQDKKQFEHLLDNFLTSLVTQWNQPKGIKSVEIEGLKLLLKAIIDRTPVLERNRPEQPLSDEALQGLHSYLEGPLLEQILIENKQKIPANITFLFGHTHKPFQQLMSFTGYSAPMNVYNSGGWVMDKVQPMSVYGAAALLIDETLQTISLRLYNQSPNIEDYIVRVEEISSSGSSPFYNRIRSLVNPLNDPWKTFSKTVAEAVFLHAQVLQTKINL